MSEEIVVSVCCATYNQIHYIKDALNSFLNQKTTFKYEIIVNDDCSNDGTKEIIMEYQQKYQNIKAIYQNENQYSKGVDIWYNFNFLLAQGKYIAICEGDDFWIDPYKLQKQVEIMEENPQCSLSFHAVKLIKNEKCIGIKRAATSNKFFTEKEIIYNDGGFVPSPSIMFPRKFIEEFPNYYFSLSVSDYPLQIFLSTKGNVIYINEVLAAYRVNAINSWSSKKENSNINKQIELRIDTIRMLELFNIETKYKYRKTVSKTIDSFCRKMFLLLNRDINLFKSENLKSVYLKQTPKNKLFLSFEYYFFLILNRTTTMKNKIRKKHD